MYYENLMTSNISIIVFVLYSVSDVECLLWIVSFFPTSFLFFFLWSHNLFRPIVEIVYIVSDWLPLNLLIHFWQVYENGSVSKNVFMQKWELYLTCKNVGHNKKIIPLCIFCNFMICLHASVAVFVIIRNQSK